MKTMIFALVLASLYIGSAQASAGMVQGLNFNLQSYADVAQCKDIYPAGSERRSGCIFEVAMDAQVRGLPVEQRFELRRCMSEKGQSFEIVRGSLTQFLNLARECHESLK